MNENENAEGQVLEPGQDQDLDSEMQEAQDGQAAAESEEATEKKKAVVAKGAQVYKVPQRFRAAINSWPGKGIDKKLFSVDECEGEDYLKVTLKDGRLLQVTEVSKVLKHGAALQAKEDAGEAMHKQHVAKQKAEDSSEKVSEEDSKESDLED